MKAQHANGSEEGFPNPPEELEERIGLTFKNRAALAAALTHSSYLGDSRLSDEERAAQSYERLEFLGDSVIGFVACERLFARHPDWDQGRLSKIKGRSVSKNTLSKLAASLGLDQYIRVGKGVQEIAGRHKTTLLCDCFEALVGAICVDRGFVAAREFVQKLLEPEIESIIASGYREDFKTALQEFVQKKYKSLPDYKLVSESGPEHNKLFKVKAFVEGRLCGEGEGPTKKEAENRAAQAALNKLKTRGKK